MKEVEERGNEIRKRVNEQITKLFNIEKLCYKKDAIDECIKICNNNLNLEYVEALSEFQDGAKSAIKIIIMDLEQLKTQLSKAVG